MANKRDLKRSINYICSELFAECVATSLATPADNKEQVDVILTSILRTHDDFVRRVSHPEPGMPTRKYYNILKEDFNKQVCEVIDNIQAL